MSSKSKATTFLLCYFLGLLGIHRFYLGRWLSGLLMLLTLGGLTIWWMVDAVLIAAGLLKDANGDTLFSGPPNPDDPSAGFWVRVAAYSVDSLIISMGLSVIGTGAAIVLPLAMIGTVEDPAALESMDPEALGETVGAVVGGVLGVVTLLAVPLYFAVQTASRHQATIGKRCFDLRVVRSGGQRVHFWRALWRSICYFISSLPLGLGYLLAAFTRRKRALHDYLAGTRVVYVAEEAARAPAQHLPEPALVDQDEITAPGERVASERSHGPGRHEQAGAERRPAVARGDGGVPTLLIVAGAVLLAGAAALAFMS